MEDDRTSSLKENGDVFSDENSESSIAKDIFFGINYFLIISNSF